MPLANGAECSFYVLVLPPHHTDRTPERFTLGTLARHNIALVFECARCWKASQMDVDRLIGRFGPDSLVQPICRKARCGRCGRLQPHHLLKYPIFRGDLAWWPRPPGATR